MLFVGDDWAEDHYDVEVADEAGTVLASGGLGGFRRQQLDGFVLGRVGPQPLGVGFADRAGAAGHPPATMKTPAGIRVIVVVPPVRPRRRGADSPLSA